MGWVEEELEKRKLPDFPGSGEIFNSDQTLGCWERRRNEAKEILRSCFYGYLPFGECNVKYECVSSDRDGYGGKAEIYMMTAVLNVYGKVITFPFQLVWPKGKEKIPVFLYLGFTTDIADGIGEWVLDEGYGIAHVYYQDLAADFPDHFKSGIARLGCRNRENSAGKLALWAFGASKVMDYLESCPIADQKKITVLGHSRLGKTALLLGAFDERFSLTAAIQSGAAGIALFRGKKGEQLEDLNRKFSHDWLCNKAYEYIGTEENLPFDQHFLVSLIAPRHLYIGSAQRDAWADPISEYLACVAGTKAYEVFGLRGLIRDMNTEKLLFYGLENGCMDMSQQGILGQSMGGKIGWHCRYGTHYLSILDWKQVILYRKIHQI